jgi:hypothetical protein
MYVYQDETFIFLTLVYVSNVLMQPQFMQNWNLVCIFNAMFVYVRIIL